MYLQKLEIQGFKSFANKVTLTFNRGITAIVGPNGSGKSNVADAVRWVLGEQSMKLLRGKKSEDVIFAGSDKKNRLGAAEVSLFLNNEDGRAPVDASEIVITRKVFRSGESEYSLNGRPTRLTDIALMLAKSNFGQRSYSIIGQGMIDEVLASTPQGRKVFFDEAAGVRAYQIKKEQAQGKMDLTRENLNRAELLVQEIEPRLRSLTRQVKRLEQRDTIEKELRAEQETYYRSVWHDVDHQLKDVGNKHKTEEQKRIKLEAERGIIEKQLREEEARSSRNAAFEKMQNEYQRFVDERNRLLREQSAVRGKRDAELTASGKTNIVWLERKRDELQSDISETEERLSDIQAEMQKTESQRHELQNKKAVLAKGIVEIEQKSEIVRKQMRHESFSAPEIAHELEQLFSKHEYLLKKLKNSTSPELLESLHKEYQQFHNEISVLLSKVRDSDNQEAVKNIEALDRELKNLHTERESFTSQEAELSGSIRALADRKIHFTDEQDSLEQELESIEHELASSSATDDTRDTLLAEQEKKIAEGIKKLEATILDARKKLDAFNQEEQQKKDLLVTLQKNYASTQQQLSDVVRLMNQYAVDIARRETRLEDLDREMRQETLPELIQKIKNTKPITDIDRGAVFGKIVQLKKQMEMIGGIDPQVSAEYEQTNERFTFLSTQVEDLQKAIADLEKAIEELDTTIKGQFQEAFQKINKEFGVTFKKLFGGGRASLELIKEDLTQDDDEADEDAEDMDDEEETQPKKRAEKVVTGVAIFATPPGKKLKSVGALSGGERALTSIALICAIIANNPSPFVVLDEVDAALDEANSERFASIIQQLQKHTQFITITHNRATMEHASILYGVTMGDDGVSKLLSVNIEHAEEIIKRHGNR